MDFDFSCAIGAVTPPTLAPERRLPDLTAALETAVDGITATWSELANRLGDQSCASLAHAPQCATNASDFGLMLGWRHLVEDWITDDRHILIICDDPWMFRELASLDVTVKGKTPKVWLKECKLAFRGLLARTWVAVRVLAEALRFSLGRKHFPANASALLVYGHPASTADGLDGYFGNLMQVEPALVRVLHVDCMGARAAYLVDNTRTFSLHGWGPLLKTLALPFARWRPNQSHLNGRFGWLVRRAAALEGSTGQAAMIRWQQHCQCAWLQKTRPRVIAWPWENHGWERELVHHTKVFGIRSIGYQHSIVGCREWNYAPRSNSNPMADTPDTICTSGPAGLTSLEMMGYPARLMTNAGALRAKTFKRLIHDPDGPVFVAFPFDTAICNQMLGAIRPLGVKGIRFIIKDHPMTPFAFKDSPGVRRTHASLADQPGVRAVLYAATTVGLEALVGGLPTLRFQPHGLVPTDPTPDSMVMPVASTNTLESMLYSLEPPPSIDPASVFSPPDLAMWHRLLTK